MTAFLTPGNLAERMLEFHRGSSGAMPTLPQSMVNALKVKTTHLGYRKKLLAVGTQSPRNLFFDCAEFGGKISVEQYFLKSTALLYLLFDFTEFFSQSTRSS